MKTLLRKLGQHRDAPRLYLDTPDLAGAGLLPGVGLRLQVDVQGCCLTLTADPTGTRKVSGKAKDRKQLPVIDINSAADLGIFGPVAVVRIVITATAVHVSLPASLAKARLRHLRLQAKLASVRRLSLAGTAFGAGVASRALHEGLADAGVPCDLVLANEICEAYLDLAKAGNPTLTPRTALAAVPMQEAAADDRLLQHVGPVDILEAGIPCSGASKAGVSKRGLARMEDHPQVGHLVGAVIQLIAALQPAIVFVENVEPYRHTASAAILRGRLRDAGYAVEESVLNARDFGSLESRVRWFLVAHPPQVPLDLSEVAPLMPPQGCLADVLEAVPEDDPRYREVGYLKVKADRDRGKGSGFGMQVLTPESRSVPVLRKGYHKGGSTDPRLLHPVDPCRSRLLTATEHARIKGIDPVMLQAASETLAHQVCGKSVDTRPVRAIAQRLAMALLVGEPGLRSMLPGARLAELDGVTG